MSPAQPAKSPRLTLRFWLIATALEVGFGLALVLVGDAALQRGLDATGLSFNTDAVTATRLVIGYPAAALAVVLSVGGVAAPDLAVLVVTWRRRGADGLAAVRRRFRFWAPEVGRRRGLRIWAATTATFVAASLATAGLDAWLMPAGHWQWHGGWGVGGLTVGLLVAMLVNLFLQSSAMALAISAIGVLLFAGLTAYDTQRIKSLYFYVQGTEMMGKTVIMGALQLYLDFINMFQFLLSFMGDRR